MHSAVHDDDEHDDDDNDNVVLNDFVNTGIKSVGNLKTEAGLEVWKSILGESNSKPVLAKKVHEDIHYVISTQVQFEEKKTNHFSDFNKVFGFAGFKSSLLPYKKETEGSTA